MNEDAGIIFLGNVFPTKTRKNPNQGRVYSSSGIAPCLNTARGGNLQPMILIKTNTKLGYDIAELGDSVNLEYPNSTTRRGRIGKQVAQTITTSPNQGAVVEAISGKELSGLAIRKLTSKECFRLMGFDDSDVDKLITNGISNTQLYKMAGNSIVVTVLENLFRQIYKPVTQSIDSLKRQSLDILDNI